MGCGSSRTKLEPLHTALNYNMQQTGVESVDKTFSNAATIMEKLENIRIALVDKRDNLSVKTGAIAYNKPDMHACLVSFFWLVSTYSNGNLKNMKFQPKTEIPFFELPNKGGKKVDKAYDTLVEYLKGVWEVKDEVETIGEEMSNLSETISNESITYVDQVKESCKDDFKKLITIPKYVINNVAKVKNAGALVNELVKEMKATVDSVNGLKELLSFESINRIDEIGSKSQKFTKAYDIVWNNLPSEKRTKFNRKKIKESYKDMMKHKKEIKGNSEKKQE